MPISVPLDRPASICGTLRAKPFIEPRVCGIRAETVAAVKVKPLHRAHQDHVPFADQFHQRQTRPKMLSRHAHDQAKVGADDRVLRIDRILQAVFHLVEITFAGELRPGPPASGDELEFVIVEFEEQPPCSPYAADSNGVR